MYLKLDEAVSINLSVFSLIFEVVSGGGVLDDCHKGMGVILLLHTSTSSPRFNLSSLTMGFFGNDFRLA